MKHHWEQRGIDRVCLITLMNHATELFRIRNDSRVLVRLGDGFNPTEAIDCVGKMWREPSENLKIVDTEIDGMKCNAIEFEIKTDEIDRRSIAAIYWSLFRDN